MSKNTKTTKREHTGRLGKNQINFIYELRDEHTMRIKSEFKKKYGFSISASRINTAIEQAKANLAAQEVVGKAVHQSEGYWIDNESINFRFRGNELSVPLFLMTTSVLVDLRNHRVKRLTEEVSILTS